MALTVKTDLKARVGETFICGMPLREDILTLLSKKIMQILDEGF